MNKNLEYTTTKYAKEVIGCCTKSLQTWGKNELIEVRLTSGGRRRYNLKKYLLDNNLEHVLASINPIKENRKNIIYCRVSSYDRKEDLLRQVELLTSKYPEYELIKDIGSGINFNRKGLNKIIEYAINNMLNEVVITYKDRLCRIGYKLVENIINKYSNGKITILNDQTESRNEEITKDLIEIITVYSSKIHGTRSNKID
jgi:predicted site-specific integrase-resolvase